jgi:Tripartite tricarboxylate transporter family receptor
MRSIWHNAMTGFITAAMIPAPAHAAHPEAFVRPIGRALARRRFLSLAAGAAALPALSHVAAAQAYPSRPITMIVPIAAGSVSDVAARVVVERMRASLGQPIIIENVSGADGSIGVGRTARAKPDGYTIDLGFTGSHVLNAAFYSLTYDVLNDFAPISPLSRYSLVLFAGKTMPATNLDEMIAWLKANPNKASAAVTSAGFRLINAFFSESNRDAFQPRAVSRHPARYAGPVGWSDRSLVRFHGSAAARAGRQDKSLCGDKQKALYVGTRHPDLCRDRIAGGLLSRVVGTFRPRGHAEGGHRQTQCGGRGRTG